MICQLDFYGLPYSTSGASPNVGSKYYPKNSLNAKVSLLNYGDAVLRLGTNGAIEVIASTMATLPSGTYTIYGSVVYLKA